MGADNMQAKRRRVIKFWGRKSLVSVKLIKTENSLENQTRSKIKDQIKSKTERTTRKPTKIKTKVWKNIKIWKWKQKT